MSRVSATLNADVNCSGGPCFWYFRYGTDGEYQYHTPVHEAVVNTGGSLHIGEDVTNLVPGTTYEYQLCGKGDGVGEFVCVGPGLSTSSSARFTTKDSEANCLYSAESVSKLVRFSNQVGYHFQCAMTFVNRNADWHDFETPWITTAGLTVGEDSNWEDWKNCRNPEDPCAPGEKRQLIITTEFWPESEFHDDPLARCARGDFDSHLRTLATNLVNDGLGDSVIRIQPEGNDNSDPESLPGGLAFPTTQQEQQWAACWRNEALTMKSVPGAHFLMDWTVNAYYRPVPLPGWYPGNRAVDIIGIDAYDRGLPLDITTQPEAWDFIFYQPNGINEVEQFAAEHGKPLAFGEWGLGRVGPPELGLGDDPTYVDNMAASVRRFSVIYQAYFLNGDPGALLESSPRSLARYKAHFGGGGDTTGNPTITPSP